MKLTIATITARAEPHYEWLVNEIARQARSTDEIELVVVDFFDRAWPALMSASSSAEVWTSSSALRSIVISPPKPTPWQGPHRVTSRDLHAIANARNTALCLASHSYIAFIDDRARIGPRWLDVVRQAADAERVICGPCDRDVAGPDKVGRVFDDRRELAPGGRRGCGGNWFYGGNFALPLDVALLVNGCEEGTDPVGRQDRVMGLMIQNCGYRIDFEIEMSARLDRRTGKASGNLERHPFPRINPGVPPADKATAIMRKFGGLRRTILTPNLTAIRDELKQGKPFPVYLRLGSDLDWFSKRPISEM